MEKVYKGALGNWKLADSANATHYIVSIEEFNGMMRKARVEGQQEQESLDNARIRQEKEFYRKRLAEKEKEFEDLYRKKEIEANRKLREAEEQARTIIEEAKNKAGGFQDVNENLTRIMIERANAKRKIKNKREHCGFIVLRSAPCLYQVKKIKEEAWTTVIQTPYDAGIELESAKYLIRNGLENMGILEGMGIWYVAENEDQGDLSSVIYEARRQIKERKGERYDQYLDRDLPVGNILFDWKYEADFVRGFWNFTMYHTEEPIITDEIRKPTSYA